MVNNEKEAIQSSESAKINTAYQARLVALGLAQPAPAVAVAVAAAGAAPPAPPVQLTPLGLAQPGLRPVLKAADLAAEAAHAAAVNKLGVGTRMKPTSKF